MSVRKMLMFITIAVFAVSPTRLFPEEEAVKQHALPLDKKFFTEFIRIPLILRDDYIESRLNTVVLARGQVTTMRKTSGLKKNTGSS